jgi:hypothetical protein
MRKYIQAQSKNGKLVIFHETAFRLFLEENEGKRMKITVDDQVTSNMRRFFEGAVVPFFALQNEIDGKKLSFQDARETLKLEFNPKYVRKLNGKLEIIGGSTTNLNKEKFRLFLEKIISYMEENGYEIPDSEDYIKWRDSGPMVGEIYPPLKRLMEKN